MKTPKEAKEDSNLAILRALKENGGGRKFNDLKDATGFHQSTLSARIKELISLGYVEYDPIERVYRLPEKGYNDLQTRELIELIGKSKSGLILNSEGGESLYPDDDLILKTAAAYAFPAINLSSLGSVKRVIHKYFMLHTVLVLAKDYIIDARSLTGEKPIENLIDEIMKNLPKHKQVLAFIIDLEKMAGIMNAEYLKEVIRLAGLEDEHRIQSPYSSIEGGYLDLFQRYALEVSALEFIRDKGKVSLTEVRKYLNLDDDEAKSILDGLLIKSIEPEMIEVYNKTGKLVRRIPLMSQEKEIKTPEGMTIKIKMKKSKAILIKTSDDTETYYEHLN